jgi:DNA-binding transcriptional ArsR family regulator
MAYEQALAALADPTRQRIVAALAGRALAVGDIARDLPVSRPAVSQHLKVLREAGIVIERRDGTRHYFSLDPAPVLALRNHFESLWQRAMGAFAQHVAAEEKKRERPGRSRR